MRKKLGQSVRANRECYILADAFDATNTASSENRGALRYPQVYLNHATLRPRGFQAVLAALLPPDIRLHHYCSVPASWFEHYRSELSLNPSLRIQCI